MKNQNTIFSKGNENTQNKVIKNNNNNKLVHLTSSPSEEKFKRSLPPPPPYNNNQCSTDMKIKTAKDFEKNTFELNRKDKKGFTTDAGGGNVLAMAGSAHGIQVNHRTSYLETLMHLFKGNVGTGIFAMGDAFRNGGILVAFGLTLFLGMICTYNMHILINCSRHIQEKYKLKESPDYAETVEKCFENGPAKLQKYSKFMNRVVNLFLCVTQLGFCCVYFVFVGSNIQQIFDYFGIHLSVHIHMLMFFIPIWLPCLVTNLKYLVPFSTVANICMISGIAFVIYYSVQDLPSINEREYFSTWEQLPLFFGTAIFAFEGICLVLPLKNQMKKQDNFDRVWGVLNVGMSVTIFMYASIGFLGYLKYGDSTEGSLTLNLPKDELLPLFVKASISIGIVLTYALQFFIAIQIMWPAVLEKFRFENNLLFKELVFRSLMVLLTFCIAEAVPNLGMFISLIGALCGAALALVFPPVCEFVIAYSSEQKGPSWSTLLINSVILLVGLLGFVTGTYESIRGIITEFFEK